MRHHLFQRERLVCQLFQAVADARAGAVAFKAAFITPVFIELKKLA